MANEAGMNRVLITGAAGRIGKVLREGLSGRYNLLRLSDIAPLGEAGPGEEVVTADICDMAATEESVKGIDCVVHLAGIPEEDTWEKIHPMNLVGAYNVFEAARRQGVKRVVFASSNHAVGYHRVDKIIDSEVQPRPDSRYGVSKVYGEALGRLYADKYGMSVSCMRIGSFQERPRDIRQLATWISFPDMVHLAERCIEAPDYHFAVAYGVSNNTRNKWDNSKVAFLGYKPKDDAERFVEELMNAGEVQDDVAKQFHGGPFCKMEFTGTTENID